MTLIINCILLARVRSGLFKELLNVSKNKLNSEQSSDSAEKVLQPQEKVEQSGIDYKKRLYEEHVMPHK